MRRFRLLAVSLALVLAALSSAPRPSRADETHAAVLRHRHPLLFGTREIYSSDNSAFFKWTGMLARFRAEEKRATRRCAPAPASSCEPAPWDRLVAELKGLPLRAQLDRVNAAINRYPYVPSFRNWGESNHWETPFEFFAKSGQCQDYAIAKYLILRAAGVPARRLRVVVLRDTRLHLDHAVTVAYLDGQALMLDNQIRDVVPVESVDHYQPYYSINERGWWLHRGPNSRYAEVFGHAAVN